MPPIRPEGDISNFVEGLGPGQIVGRQALASPNLGNIQLSLCDRKGNLEVEVIRARGLQAKQGAKILPGEFRHYKIILASFQQFEAFCETFFCKLMISKIDEMSPATDSILLLPSKAPYVKVYLVKGRKCIAKAKTTSARRTLDPLYQQQLVFREDYRGCILQVRRSKLSINHCLINFSSPRRVQSS